jgi:hypothetical protein
MGSRPPINPPKQVREVKDFDSSAFGDAGIGQKDLIELKNRGYSKGAIRRYIDSERDKGTAIGGKVEGSLELMGARGPRNEVKGYNYKDFGDGKGFGFADVRELSRQGYGQDAIRSHMEDLRKQGVTIGERAGMSIDLMSPSGRPGRKAGDVFTMPGSLRDTGAFTPPPDDLVKDGKITLRDAFEYGKMRGGSPFSIPAPKFHGIK